MVLSGVVSATTTNDRDTVDMTLAVTRGGKDAAFAVKAARHAEGKWALTEAVEQHPKPT